MLTAGKRSPQTRDFDNQSVFKNYEAPSDGKIGAFHEC